MRCASGIVLSFVRTAGELSSRRVGGVSCFLALAVVTSACGRAADVLDGHRPGRIGSAVELAPTQFGMCARTTEGTVACWRAGYPDTVNVAGEFSPSERFASAGSQGYACIVDSGGGLSCKDITADGPLVPVDIVGSARDVSVGFWGGCALSEPSQMQCWGNAATGLNVGPLDSDILPYLGRLETKPLPGYAVQVAFTEEHGCAVLDDGRVFCHGVNDHGVVDGIPNRDTRTGRIVIVTPIALAGITDAAQVALSASGTCVLHREGTVTCVGSADMAGLGGRGNEAVRGQVAVTGVKAIAASRVSTCALTEAGELYCWGLDMCGAVRDVEGPCGETIASTAAPTLVSSLGPAKTFGMDDSQLCIVDFEDEVWCRGFRWDYDIGTAVAQSTPYRVPL